MIDEKKSKALLQADDSGSVPTSCTMPGVLDPPGGVSPYKRRRTVFILAVVCQLLSLTGLASVKAYTLVCGTTVTLQVVPLDPRDMFRGDYVSLNYAISTVRTKESFEPDSEAFVTLEKNGLYWIASNVSKDPPALSHSQVAIKGKIGWVNRGDWNSAGEQLNRLVNSQGAMNEVHVRYGIEQAFVPEGTGRKLEKLKKLKVDVAIDHFGNSVVKSVRPE